MKRLSKNTAQVLLAALAGHNQLLVEASFWNLNQAMDSAVAKKSSKSILPILDEFIHGSSVYPALSIDEIINHHGQQQAKQSAYLTKAFEKKTELECMMSDGPFCLPTDKYYGHSKLLYPESGNALRNPTKFGQLWSRA